MSYKNKIIISVVVLLTTFALGRYSASKPDTTFNQTTQTDTNKHVDKDTSTHSVATTTKAPDGTIKTVVITDIVSKKDTTIQKDIKTDTTATSTSKSDKVTIALLGGLNTITRLPVYGGSVSKELLGPITIGIWGLNNGTIGMSAGLEF